MDSKGPVATTGKALLKVTLRGTKETCTNTI